MGTARARTPLSKACPPDMGPALWAEADRTMLRFDKQKASESLSLALCSNCVRRFSALCHHGSADGIEGFECFLVWGNERPSEVFGHPSK